MVAQSILPVALAGLLIAFSGGMANAAPGHGHGRGHLKTNNLKGVFLTAGMAYDASITGTVSEPNPPTVPFASAGFLQFDGRGNITSGEETMNYGSPGTGDSFTCDLAGTYTVDSATGRVIMTVTVTAGPAVTTAESTASNDAQCGGTGTWVGYLNGPNGKSLYTVEQTNTGGTPTPPAASTTPILSAHVWTKN
ncbi:MAG TPA: hypothetical protein VMV15_11105 [Candidatus Binataceae bacterium]|nr:hypothetical protein [Candidatus Binataceae bacterium]